jgi:hypothetical protein
MLDTVHRQEIVPPTPTNLRLVTEQDGQSRMGQRRFSWAMPVPPPFAQNWLDGVVSDIATFEVRYRNGVDAKWEGAFVLLSDGIPGDTYWFETKLMDYGTFTVMLRAKDRTGHLSEEAAVVTVGIGQPIPTNVLQLLDLAEDAWPGLIQGGTVIGSASALRYQAPLTGPMYEDPQIEQMHSGRTGGHLTQDDVAAPMFYRTVVQVPVDGSGLIIYTEAQRGTYRWFVEDVTPTGQELRYIAPLTDPMYGAPLTEPFHLEGYLAGGVGLHPYAPHEKLTAGTWRIWVEAIANSDGPAVITDVDVVLDVPDVVWTANDRPTSAGVTAIPLPAGMFRQVKAVSLAVQDDTGAPGVAVGGQIVFKDPARVDVRTVDAAGAAVAALVDLIVVGF